MSKIIIAVILIGLLVFFFQRSQSNKQQAQQNIEEGKAFLDANKNQEGIKTTSSGLQYMVLKTGTGTVHPKASDQVTVHYHGTLIDGTVFDSSIERGEPIAFSLNQVIRGWTEGLQLMVEGEKVRLFIPADLAYGNRSMGKIGPGSVLIFDVELLKIN
ncbi:FKBP-type peptidyl-prolyl cis-trans isomerase [Photobacterium sp. R1]